MCGRPPIFQARFDEDLGCRMPGFSGSHDARRRCFRQGTLPEVHEMNPESASSADENSGCSRTGAWAVWRQTTHSILHAAVRFVRSERKRTLFMMDRIDRGSASTSCVPDICAVCRMRVPAFSSQSATARWLRKCKESSMSKLAISVGCRDTGGLQTNREMRGLYRRCDGRSTAPLSAF